MGSYTFQKVLQPGEYDSIGHIRIKRPPFVDFTFDDLKAEGFCVLLHAKYCIGVGHTKLVVRPMKVGDHASVSIQFWVNQRESARTLRDVDSIFNYLEDQTLYAGFLHCKNLTDRGQRLYHFQEFDRKNTLTLDDIVDLITTKFEMHDVLKALNDRRAKDIVLRRPIGPVADLEEAYARATEETNVISLVDAMAEIFGEEALTEMLKAA